jgi:hypothetical protein
MEAAIVAALAPFLPYLLRAGQRAGEEVSDQLGTAAGQLATSIWKRIRPKIEARESAQEAADDVAARPTDARARGALELQLEKLLAEDERLAAELRDLLDRASSAGIVVADVVIGGNVSSDRGGVTAARDITGGVRTGR